jgi:hypothetical protein
MFIDMQTAPCYSIQASAPPALRAEYFECPRGYANAYLVVNSDYDTKSSNSRFEKNFTAHSNVAVLGGYKFIPAIEFERKDISEAILQANSAWQVHLSNSKSSTNIDSITETIDGVFDAIEKFGPAVIELRHLKSEQIEPEHLAAILRATATIHDQIPGWTSALEVAKRTFESLGHDPSDALFGLI